MILPSELHTRIFNLTFQDLQNKSVDALYASLLEEIGELARELKIEYQVFGNTYKKPDEGVKGESVDVYICCVAMMYASLAGESPTLEKHEKIMPILKTMVVNFTNNLKSNKNNDVFAMLRTMVRAASEFSYCNSTGNSAANYAMMIYDLHGETAEFFEILSNKLDKWENSQNGKLENMETQPEVSTS